MHLPNGPECVVSRRVAECWETKPLSVSGCLHTGKQDAVGEEAQPLRKDTDVVSEFLSTTEEGNIYRRTATKPAVSNYH